ncbi:hypothetical protein EI94DRAFT_1599918, partial [Lactarius quietus]
RIGRAEEVKCPACGHLKEDTKHFLMDCPLYAHERWALYRHCKKRNPSLKTLLNEKMMMVPIANYIQATGQFEIGGDRQSREGRRQMQ